MVKDGNYSFLLIYLYKKVWLFGAYFNVKLLIGVFNTAKIRTKKNRQEHLLVSKHRDYHRIFSTDFEKQKKAR